jgi:hypothetical protein
MVSYTITVCNEDRELDKLLNFLRVHIKDTDEIVLQLDSEKATDDVRKIASIYQELIPSLKVIEFALNDDFGAFKNNLKLHCTKEWIFNIDADEMPAGHLIDNISELLEMNPNLDVLFVPRWNVVEGITAEHINTWKWRLDEFGRINWPDWQMRIYRNTEKIHWNNKVHEVLQGFENYSALPEEKDWCLFHNKTINRQEQQNNYYNTIGQ